MISSDVGDGTITKSSLVGSGVGSVVLVGVGVTVGLLGDCAGGGIVVGSIVYLFYGMFLLHLCVMISSEVERRERKCV